MFNVILDELPEHWNGYPIDTDFRIGIQISQCLSDESLNNREKIATAISLLFPAARPGYNEAIEALEWFLNECDHDNHERSKKSNKVKALDFDVDQWRLYAAFWKQYGIDLNTVHIHWFKFLGLISNLEECNFTRVIEIRQKKLSPNASAEERKRTREAKKVYDLSYSEADNIDSEQEERSIEAQNEFMKILGKV